MIGDVDTRYQESLKKTFDEINQARAEAILGVRASIGDIDRSLEARITQLSLIMMEAFATAQKIASDFTPEAFQSRLIAPTMNKLDASEEKIFQDIDTHSYW